MMNPEKRIELTFHEKQMRFFTRLGIGLFAVGTALGFWCLNMMSFSHR